MRINLVYPVYFPLISDRILVRIFILTLLLLLSSKTNASADNSPIFVYYYEKNYALTITEDGACGSIFCIEVFKKPRSKTPVLSIPFENECSLTLHGEKIKNIYSDYDGFVCHPKGRTRLAGASYKRIQFGRPDGHDCEMNEKSIPEQLGTKYICIKGCSNSQVPELLTDPDGQSC